MLSDIMKEMEESARNIFRERALYEMESYKAGAITLEEVAELVGRLARMEKYCALTVAAMRKAIANEGGSK